MDTGDRSTYESVCISSITFPWTHGDGGLHRAPSTRPSLPQPGPLGKGPPDVSAKLAWGCWEQGTGRGPRNWWFVLCKPSLPGMAGGSQHSPLSYRWSRLWWHCPPASPHLQFFMVNWDLPRGKKGRQMRLKTQIRQITDSVEYKEIATLELWCPMGNHWPPVTIYTYTLQAHLPCVAKSYCIGQKRYKTFPSG